MAYCSNVFGEFAVRTVLMLTVGDVSDQKVVTFARRGELFHGLLTEGCSVCYKKWNVLRFASIDLQRLLSRSKMFRDLLPERCSVC